MRLPTSVAEGHSPFLVTGMNQSTYYVEASPWCGSRIRRMFELMAAGLVFVAVLPLLLLIVVAVRLTSPGPAIFRQRRVGLGGQAFTIFKFRTMVSDTDGSLRSVAHDPRITQVGRFLRRYKLDELPQLVNVIRGDMSLVGPRPKLHGHHSIDVHFRPGITGAATLAFASEENLLRHIPEDHLEDCHRQLITPRKLELDLDYMARATFRSDLRLLWRTLMRSGRYATLDEIGTWQPPYPMATYPTASSYAPLEPIRRIAGSKHATVPEPTR